MGFADLTGSESFSASGEATVAIDCAAGDATKKSCTAVDSPFLVKGSLTSPVAITPAYPAGPTGHDRAGCAAAAKSPSWTLSEIFYANQTGNGVDSVASQTINLLVTNKGIDYTTSCFPAGFGEDLVLQCAGVEFQSMNTGRYSLQSAATFDAKTGNFTFTQTWYCDDVDAARP